MIVGSIVRVYAPQAGHWKSSQVSRTTLAVGEPSVRPSRATVAGIVVDGAVSSTAAEPDPGTVDPAPADEPGAGLPRSPVPAPFEAAGRKLSTAMTTTAIAM